jgi:hypothetical protein
MMPAGDTSTVGCEEVFLLGLATIELRTLLIGAAIGRTI